MSKFNSPEYPDGRDLALSQLLQLHARGPTRPSSLAKRAPQVDDDDAVRTMPMTDAERAADKAARSNADAATAMLKSVHAHGPEPFAPDTVCSGPLFIERSRDPTVAEIRKAQDRPHGLHPYANRQIDLDAIGEMLKHARRLRKLGLPPQSANATWDSITVHDGATGIFRDQTAPGNTSSQLGPRHAASISAARPPAQDVDSDATIAAIKAVFKRGPQRF
jgi:hypothetical protein